MDFIVRISSIGFIVPFCLTLTSIFGCEVEVSLPKVTLNEHKEIPILPPRKTFVPRHRYNEIDPGPQKFVLMCYYCSWASYRPEPVKLTIESIDSHLCTHLIYGFAGIDHEGKLKALSPGDELNESIGKYNKFANLKKSNPKLKILLSVGGWNEGSFRYSIMASNLTSRRAFVVSVSNFLERYDFDGLDISWEYPSTRGGRPEDKRNFAELLREIRQSLPSSRNILTVGVSANKWTIDSGYDVVEISRNVDYINLMTYDYHGGWESTTDHNSPLYPRPDKGGLDVILNVNYSVNYWLSKGASRDKITLGLPFFGRSFTLAKPEKGNLGARTVGLGRPGPYAQESGSLAYNEICELRKKENWTIKVNEYQLAPYGYYEDQWVGFDDEDSIMTKVRYMKAMKLGGVFAWSIENDDANGICSNKKFPLLKAALAELKSPISVLPEPKAVVGEKRPEKTTSTTEMPFSWTPSTKTSSKSTITWWPTSSTARSPPVSTESSLSSTIGLTSLATSRLTPASTESSSFSSTRLTSSSTTSGSSSTTSDPSLGEIDKGIICKYPGTFVHPYDCRKFYRCVRISIEEKYKIYEYTCPGNTVFDVDSRNCLWDYLIPNCRTFRDSPKHFRDKLAIREV